MGLITIGMLLFASLAVGVFFWYVTGKKLLLAGLATVLTIICIAVALIFPIYKRHSFELSQSVRSGETVIPFDVPFLAPLKGSYTLSIVPTSGESSPFSVSGHIQGKDNKTPRFEFARQSRANNKGQQKIGLGVNITQPISRNGILFLSIRGEPPDNEFSVWLGRIFP